MWCIPKTVIWLGYRHSVLIYTLPGSWTSIFGRDQSIVVGHAVRAHVVRHRNHATAKAWKSRSGTRHLHQNPEPGRGGVFLAKNRRSSRSSDVLSTSFPGLFQKKLGGTGIKPWERMPCHAGYICHVFRLPRNAVKGNNSNNKSCLVKIAWV